MLDKKSEKILSYIIAKHNENPTKEDNVILVSHKEFNMSCDQLNSLLLSLHKTGYICPFICAYQNDPAEINLTHSGLCYFETKWKQTIKDWLPTIVSIAGAIASIIGAIVSIA